MPAAVAAFVVRASVEAPEVIEDGVKVAVTPAGRPETDSTMEPLKPLRAVGVIV